MQSSERIRQFVRDTLGCGCPEEVFRSIDVRRCVRLNNFIVLDGVFIIGNRLLVYVADAGTEACIEEHLPVLLRSGRDERDEKGLNRFRLALLTDRPDEVQRAAVSLFEELRGNDEKMHLHVIGRRDNPFTAENPEEKQEGTKGGP